MSRFFEALERADRETSSRLTAAASVEAPPAEPPRTEPPRTEPPRTEPPRTEPPRTEPPRTEAPRKETPPAEPSRTEPKAEAARTEAPPAEPPRAEPPPTEPPHAEPPHADPSHADPPRAEWPRAEPLRTSSRVFDLSAPTVVRYRDTRIEEHLVSLLEPRSFEAEEYRVIRHAVETLRKDANLQVVAVTSPAGGDGKTTTAINLAGALAQSRDARVLLADLDLRRPALARQLGLGGQRRTLVDALIEPGIGLLETVAHLPRFNLSVAVTGGMAAAPYELLKSPRLAALLAEARARYDYVVLDTPPFVPVSDCRLVTKYVDGFLIVVTAHRTARGALAETLNLIDPSKVVGLVFNADKVGPPDYHRANAELPRGARWRGGRRP
jgi:capsular exopolysaccharide synthesis family protein